MAGIEVNILGKKYVFLGVGNEVTNQIEGLANNEYFKRDFEVWKRWMEKKVEGNIIVVCDPYGIAGISGSDLPKERTEIVEKARAVTDELANQLALPNSWRVAQEKPRWTDNIINMFSHYNSGRIYGMQYSTQYALMYAEKESFWTILFIDFQSEIEKRPGLLLPIVLHETTHFLEEKTIEISKPGFGDDGVLLSRVDNNELWGVRNLGNLCKEDGWEEIFDEMQKYQKNNAEERMPTLVEKMAVGSLYESGNREWIEELKTALYTALKEKGVEI